MGGPRTGLHYVMPVSVNIAVDKDCDFKSTLAKARKAGLNVSAAFEGLGIVSGTIDKEALVELRRMKGLKSVEEDREVGFR